MSYGDHKSYGKRVNFFEGKNYLKTWQYFTVSYSHIKLHYLYINNAKYTVSNKSYVNMK